MGARPGNRTAKKRAPKRAEPFKATLTVDLGRGGRARAAAVVRALRPEARQQLPGSAVEVKALAGRGALEIVVEASSLRTLRASVNSYLRWADLAIEVAGRAASPEEGQAPGDPIL